MRTNTLPQALREEIAALAADLGCGLLEADFRGGVLRLVLDHPEGVTLAHCETVSRQASALLDVTDFGPGRYTLEVSSPGLDRKLYDVKDFDRFSGEQVRVTWRSPEDGKRTVVGTLDGGRAGREGRLLITDVRDMRYEIRIDDLVEARLEPSF
jgi:ribosome maturation factor RimP